MPQRRFLPTATLEMLRLRARLLGVVRSFFEQRGYVEVETPLLSHDVVVDAWLEPIVVPAAAAVEGSDPSDVLYLQTSPEFGMKRLLAAGAEAVYQVTRAFRRGELGRYHNPEFTMVEWYKVGDTHHGQMRLVEELTAGVLEAAAELGVAGDAGRPVLRRPFARMTYDELFLRYCGCRVLNLAADELRGICFQRGIEPPPGLGLDDVDGWLNLLLNVVVEPELRRERSALFVYDYPASQAALAQVRDGHPPVAERFELYLSGIEICNGYHELTDADELRHRIARQSELRRRAGLPKLPEHSRLLDALEAGLPDCAGVALGFDRLVMVAAGAESLHEVLAFPFERA